MMIYKIFKIPTKRLIILIIYLYTFICCGCEKLKENIHYDYSKEKTHMTKEDHGYYYKLSKIESRKFLAKVRKLKIGCSIEHVINELGKPDYFIDRFGKEPNSSYKGVILRYYLKRWEKGFVNELKDSYISVTFGRKNKMQEVFYKNIKE